MKNERHKYRRHRLDTFETAPESCPVCKSTRILVSATRDVPFVNTSGGSRGQSSTYIFMCCGCGHVLGFADQTLTPADVLKAHSRPDLGAKYEGVILHV